MKKQLINICTTSVIQIIGLLLIVVAAILAVSAVLAQPYGTSPKSAKGCIGWPSETEQGTVEAAFDKVLIDSATDQTLRNELLDSSDCFKKPKAAVQRILNAMPGKIQIPPAALIIFYENDSSDFLKPRPPFDDYPSDHCLHIFFLPPVGAPAAKTSFRENLMCCYKPWKPTRPTPSK
jgi:hypothetical protein